MVSTEKISRKFIQLDEYLGILDKIAEVSENAFLKDKILIGSAKYYLQISLARQSRNQILIFVKLLFMGLRKFFFF